MMLIIRSKNYMKARYRRVKEKKRIIVDILFNAWKRSSRIYDRDWIENRMKIFMNYTLKRLKGQSNQNYIALVRYDRSTEKLIRQALSKYPPLPPNIKFIDANSYNREIINSAKGYDHLYICTVNPISKNCMITIPSRGPRCLSPAAGIYTILSITG